MSVKDVIKKSILNSENYTSFDVGKITLTLLIAVLLGVIIYMIYKKFYAGVIYSRSFAVTLVGMTVMTAMITLAISTNVVISLGMVGALSIVRFRTAIKDPMDLLYLFWAISSGITVGAGMYVLALIVALIMYVLIWIFYARQNRDQIYMAVIHYTGDNTGDAILRELHKTKFYIKSRTFRGSNTELAVEVNVKNNNLFFEEKIRNLENVQDITLIQYNGEYHG
jgi:uncharacterized membrane protein YhiD involved in acid resistance